MPLSDPNKKTRVAAILYFEEGCTVDEVKAMLQKVAKEAQKGDGPCFNRMTVDGYNPEWGSPVWYIP